MTHFHLVHFLVTDIGVKREVTSNGPSKVTSRPIPLASIADIIFYSIDELALFD